MTTTPDTQSQSPPSQVQPPSISSSEELAAKALQKRYERLITVKSKAIKGKGAWYWNHLEPILLHSTDTNLPKSVKLHCSLCDAVFSASNPSRTASDHLKRGTCPNFNSLSTLSPPPQPPPRNRKRHSSAVEPESYNVTPLTVVDPLTFSGGDLQFSASSPPPPPQPPSSSNHGERKRKRHSSAVESESYNVKPLTIVDPLRIHGGDSQFSPSSTAVGSLTKQPHLILSGGKDDLGPLAMLEDSVKKLKSPKTSPFQNLNKSQIDSALDSFSDWVFESCGSVSLSSLEHPKFKAFLTQIGLPIISIRDFITGKLDLAYEDSKSETESRIHEAMFFQIASNGWKFENLINLIVNLPNGTSLYKQAVFVNGAVPSNYAEEVLWETVKGICGNSPQKCIGIVSDRFKTKALKNLENQHQWMVNLSCQFQEFKNLIQDFIKELPLLKSITQRCSKLVDFLNKAPIRDIVSKYEFQEQGEARMLHLPLDCSSFQPLYNLLEDVLNSSRVIHLVIHDDACQDHLAREVIEMVEDVGFWTEVDAVYSLLKLVKDMARRIEEERPLIGQCLPLWDELRSKIKDWYVKFNVVEERQVLEKLVETRFKKCYHPAWAAAFILDPVYLIRDNTGKYLPPSLSEEQEKDVDKLITRLVSRDEVHIAMMELKKWRTEGLDPVYAQAVQMKEKDPVSGKMRIANPQSSRLFGKLI